MMSKHKNEHRFKDMFLQYFTLLKRSGHGGVPFASTCVSFACNFLKESWHHTVSVFPYILY